ncbi:uncharacterized protein TNCV_3746681 [Trichonephila clavipes]|nr:uncharacterized protein TNCV_3746681 [Trichonephila clavipes]
MDADSNDENKMNNAAPYHTASLEGNGMKNHAKILAYHQFVTVALEHTKGLGSNPGESMDVCKCIVPLWHEGTLNSHRAASSLMRLVEGEESWEASDHLRMFSLKIGVEPSQIVLSPA